MYIHTIRSYERVDDIGKIGTPTNTDTILVLIPSGKMGTSTNTGTQKIAQG